MLRVKQVTKRLKPVVLVGMEINSLVLFSNFSPKPFLFFGVLSGKLFPVHSASPHHIKTKILRRT